MVIDKGKERKNSSNNLLSRISRLSRSRAIIITIIIALVVVSIVMATNALAQKPSIENSLLAEQYGLPNALETIQEVAVGETTVRLLYVIPSATETLVELEILDPSITEGSHGTSFLAPRLEVNLSLSGFQMNELLGSPNAKIIQGAQRFVLDLPPLVDIDGIAIITLQDLLRFNPVTGEKTVVTGLWQFSFTPIIEPGQLDSKEFEINQHQRKNDVRIRLSQGRISATETLIYCQIEGTDEDNPELMAQPSLEFDDEVLIETGRYNINGFTIFSFPSIRNDVDTFTVVFPPAISNNQPSVNITVPLENYQAELAAGDTSIEIDEVVNVREENIRFTELTQLDGYFFLRYEPANHNEYKGLLLVDPGLEVDAGIFEATDDRGNTYAGRGSGTTFYADGHKLKNQRIDFDGFLDWHASKLYIAVSSTSIVGEPFVFEVTIKS